MQESKDLLIKFIGDIPTYLKAADEYWADEKNTGKYDHSLQCETHGELLNSSWFPANDWESKAGGFKFCHFCGGALKIVDTEVVNEHVGHGNFQLIIWDEKFRQVVLDKLEGREPAPEVATEKETML